MVKTVVKPIKLNLGCRDRKIDGFIGIDCDPHPGVEHVQDCSSLYQFGDGEVSEIYASHILEHFPHAKTLDVLREWARALEPGGKLYVAVPDFARCVELYPMTGLDNWIVNFLMGDQGYHTAFHYAIFDEERLTRLLKEAGFADSFRVEEFEYADDGECSNLASTFDGERVSLNVIATR